MTTSADLPIVLTGFMGAGKTTIGRLLAKALGRTFADLDEHIESVAGKSIPALFLENGEAGFRTLEADVLDSLLGVTPAMIIAAGGGSVVREENRTRLRERAVTIFLDPPFDEIWRRIAENRRHRPLACDASREDLERLHAERYSWYADSAEIRIAETASPDKILIDITSALESFRPLS